MPEHFWDRGRPTRNESLRYWSGPIGVVVLVIAAIAAALGGCSHAPAPTTMIPATYSGPKGVPSQGLNNAAYGAYSSQGGSGWNRCTSGGCNPSDPNSNSPGTSPRANQCCMNDDSGTWG